jgi:hypothetical protein
MDLKNFQNCMILCSEVTKLESYLIVKAYLAFPLFNRFVDIHPYRDVQPLLTATESNSPRRLNI